MGAALMAEMLDDAPADLSAAERLVLAVLAQSADDATREVDTAEATREVLTRRTGLTRSGLKKTLSRLAGRGLEVRVVIAIDRAGRPLYAHEGQATTYRIPVLRGDLLGNPLTPERGPAQAPSQGGEESPHGPQVHRPVPADEHVGDELDAAAAEVARILGPCDDAHAIAQQVQDKHHPEDLPRYIARIPPRNLARYRSAATRGGKSRADRCRHGDVGGERILGRGEQASRKCPKCEAEDPAYRSAAAS